MKHWKLWLFAVLILKLVACAGAENQEQMMKAAPAPLAPLEIGIDGDSLSADQLQAMEWLARQKVMDFWSYLKLAADPNQERAFRAQALELAQDLMTDPALISWDKDQLQVDTTALGWLQPYLRENAETQPQLGEVSAFQLTETGEYRGTLEIAPSDQGIKHRIGLQIFRETKRFGNQEKDLWVLKVSEIDLK
ncbi:MAG: hypothetical protein ACFB10_16165 [Salibacteraceae bacterium]